MSRSRQAKSYAPAPGGPVLVLRSRQGWTLRLTPLAVQAPGGPAVFAEQPGGWLRIALGNLVIRFRAGAPERARRSILKRFGLTVARINPFIRDQLVARGAWAAPELIDVANALNELDEIVLATPSFLSEHRRQGTPSISPQAWHLRHLKTLEAWKLTTGRREITVAVLDDGVDLDHPDLSPNLCDGRDFVFPDGDPGHFDPRPKRFRFPFDRVDGNDIHGTACAGLVVSRGLPGRPVGVAPGCRVLPIRIFQGDDLVADERVADAIRYAATRADILCCAWCGGQSWDVLLALEDAGLLGRGGRGSAVFCAAGNDSGNRIGFPARDRHGIAVGAATDESEAAEYSNRGPELSVVAPSSGGLRGIFTTDVSALGRGFNPEGLHTDRFGGTSAATALAAGVGALVLSVRPDISREDLRHLLQETADKIGRGYDPQGHSDELGYGRVDAGRAVEEALKAGGLS